MSKFAHDSNTVELADEDLAEVGGGVLSRWDTYTCDVAGALSGTIAGVFTFGLSFGNPTAVSLASVFVGNGVKNFCLDDYENRINVPSATPPAPPPPVTNPDAPVWDGNGYWTSAEAETNYGDYGAGESGTYASETYASADFSAGGYDSGFTGGFDSGFTGGFDSGFSGGDFAFSGGGDFGGFSFDTYQV